MRGLCDSCYDRWLYANSERNRNTKLENAAKWRTANVEKVKIGQRANHLKKRYGISEAEYQAMLTKQKHKCAICRKRAKLHIDHCHSTGKVRGLLCLRCNGSLAWLEQILKATKSGWFERAKAYLNA